MSCTDPIHVIASGKTRGPPRTRCTTRRAGLAFCFLPDARPLLTPFLGWVWDAMDGGSMLPSSRPGQSRSLPDLLAGSVQDPRCLGGLATLRAAVKEPNRSRSELRGPPSSRSATGSEHERPWAASCISLQVPASGSPPHANGTQRGALQATDILLIHVAATWALVGLIWTVQLVQYPGFAFVSDEQLPALHENHCSRITWVVAPLMLCELITGLALFSYRPTGLSQPLLWMGFALIAINWASTALVAMPLHAKVRQLAPHAQGALVASNWVRTITWSLRGALTLFALRAALGPA